MKKQPLPFVGRAAELALLEEAYASPKGELVVIYGRRRVGKSELVKTFLAGKPGVLAAEGLEGERTEAQIRQFLRQAAEQTGDPLLARAVFPNWSEVFAHVTEKIISSSKHKPVLFLDELQWMAAGQSRLVSLLKYYWDNHWKPRGVLLILCGSVASFMVGRVVQSRALYGRVTVEIPLKGLSPAEAASLFRGKRSREEILRYLMVFGGIPKYLEDIRLDQSFAQNMNRLCFSRNAAMIHEVQKIFFGQFREADLYRRIAVALKDAPLSLPEIRRRVGGSSGGGFTRYLENMERAEMIRTEVPFGRPEAKKGRRYILSDEFILFYFKFLEPHLRTIQASQSPHLFETLTGKALDPWLGLAFERFCQKNAWYLAQRMGFGDQMIQAAPLYKPGDKGYQFDLVYERSDKVITLCEIKHVHQPLTTALIPEMEKKKSRFAAPRGYTLENALISLYGPDTALRQSRYFHHTVTLDRIL
jgi:AAA+ ATPase superfamily predicted ATPase